jgi:hypothetical protein
VLEEQVHTSIHTCDTHIHTHALEGIQIKQNKTRNICREKLSYVPLAERVLLHSVLSED